MSNIEIFYEKLNIDRDLTMKFFVSFSRYEYALKRSGITNGNSENVQANWDRYASFLNDKFDPSRNPQLQKAVQYYLNHPPRKQCLENGQLAWREINRNTSQLLPWLLMLIRTVRNNLFHGGKFPYEPVQDPSRDGVLLEGALVILFECLDLADGLGLTVKQNFLEEI